LRSLIKIHVHVVRRGIAVLHVAKEGRIFSSDPWDSKVNQKIEETIDKKAKLNPDKLPDYSKMTTFRGYIYFNDITDLQKKLYQEIKDTKRKEIHKKEMEEEQAKDPINQAYNSIVDMLLDGKYKTMVELERNAFVLGIKVTSFKNRVREYLRERGEERPLSQILKENTMEQDVVEKKKLFGLS